MATGDGWESRLIAGLAAKLATAGIGVWHPDGTPYAAGEIGIYDGLIPPSPDTIITLADYPVSPPARGLADLTVGVQARLRGTTDRRIVSDLGAAIYDLLDSSGRQTWGTTPNTVSIVDVYRTSYAPLGQDNLARWEASHNYTVEAMRPTAHRTD